MKKVHLIAVLLRPVDRIELFSALKYYGVEKLTLVLFSDSTRLGESTVRGWFHELDIDYNIVFLIKSELNLDKFERFISGLGEYSHLMLSLAQHRAFYKLVPKVRKAGKTIIQLSDGMSDSFDYFSFCFGYRVRNLKTFFSTLVVYFELAKAQGDVCFFQLYPLQSCLAKVTLPVINAHSSNEIPGDIKKLLLENHVDSLILTGEGVSYEIISSAFQGINNYCITSKAPEIIINGTRHVLKTFVTAENIIESNLVSNVYGYPSTAVVYAKLNKPEINCGLVFTGSLNKLHGIFYERNYKKVARKLNISIASTE